MFEPQKISFSHGDNEFIYRVPTVRDEKAIMARKSFYCMDNGIVPDFLDVLEREYLTDLARLEVCLEKCPDSWRDKKKENEDIGRVNTENVNPEELSGVLGSWRKALQEFPGS